MTYALNAINRSMGERDLYPFVISPEIEAKLAFIDTMVSRCASHSMPMKTQSQKGDEAA